MNAQLDDVLHSLNAKCVDVDRAAESIGVAAETVASGSLAPRQMSRVAEGLRDLQFELQDLSETLRRMVQSARVVRQ